MDNIQIPITSVSRRGSCSSCHSSNSLSRSPTSHHFSRYFGGGTSPGGISITSHDGGGGGSYRRYVISPHRRVCTMDCSHCRQMARQIRDELVSPFFECASAPCSRKSSGGVGKSIMKPKK
ncbi:uncharacterized protein [Lepeophtheirus salmonis]|uniref:uncharacterized protein n=1 Tax=Lepeophtheirus salmonis TaxID=72036 RepID=UPI003AF404B6